MCIEIIMLIDNVLNTRYTFASLNVIYIKRSARRNLLFVYMLILTFSFARSLSLSRSLVRSLSRSIHVRFLFTTN